MLSHLPSTSPLTPYLASDPLAAASARSSRCLVVMHSCDLMIALGQSRDSRMALTVKVLPVASTP